MIVPHELLDGELTVLENGVDRGIVYYKIENYSVFNFQANSDKTHVEIIGTSAIPEFSIVPIILLISFIPILLVSKLRVKFER
jgi:hypothetical protein